MKKLIYCILFSVMISYQLMAAIITPVIAENQKNSLIKHAYYIVGFSPKFHTPNWVAYEIIGTQVNSNVANRSKRFYQDPLCHFTQANDKDYFKSGFDRGHLAPAEDFDFSKLAMHDSFYYTNVAPQNSNLNRGEWQELEHYVREKAILVGKVWVITGIYYKNFTNAQTIGGDQIGVPDYFWKVIGYYQQGKWMNEAYIIPNQATHLPFSFYRISLDQLSDEIHLSFPEGMQYGTMN